MKSIPSSNYTVRPFVTHKEQTYTLTFQGGNNPPHVSLDVATAPPDNGWLWSDGEVINPEGIHARPLYASVKHLFDLTPINPTDTLFVLNIAQIAYGERIHPGTLTLESPDSPTILIDNGDGRIMNSADLTQQLGIIDYRRGVVVIRESSGQYPVNADGLNLLAGDTLDVRFNATVTIHEHQIVCTMDAGEFNYSLNPSVGGHTLSGEVPFSLFGDNALSPYMTSVGLYNDAGELLGVAKFPRPLKRATSGQQTVIIRFDV